MKTKIVNDPKLEKSTYTFKFEGKENKVVIQEPNFEQLSLALSAMITTSGRVNLGGAGKVIFDLCCVEHGEAVLNAKNLLSVCVYLANHYLGDLQTEIEKK